MKMIKIIAACLLIWLSLGQALGQQKKVLFLGNSYTGANNLPSLVYELASSAGDELYTERSTPGGYTLGNPSNGHLYTQASIDLIKSNNWDYVVLQEQSQYPVIEYFRNNYTYTGAAGLDSVIRENDSCSQTLFYMTWGRKYGGQQCIGSYCSVDFVDYAHMQDSLASAYLNMSNGLSTPVAPAGMAWRKSIVGNGDPIDLFSSDGSHPSMAGSYLTACVFYASIFHKSPEGIEYDAGLGANTRDYLQAVAHQTVFNNLNMWNIDTTTVTANFDYEQLGDSVYFENLSQHATNYLWDFGNGNTDTTENPVYAFEESGTYKVRLLSYAGCEVDTATHYVDFIISDIIQHQVSGKIKLFPNPCKNSFSVTHHGINGEVLISLTDASGRNRWLVKRQLKAGYAEFIDNVDLEAGLYVCQIRSKTHYLNTRLMVIQ